MTEPRRDRWGRYRLPDPQTGEQKSWTRATTWASSVADTYGLTKWKLRMAAKGVATRRDLIALASSLSVTEDKDALDRLAEQAIEHVGGTAANLGTALHAFTEQVDGGEHPEIPEPWDRDIAAYRQMLDAAGIETIPRYIERIVVVPELGVAGTLDRVVRLGGKHYIADVKTGADLKFSWGEIAIQLALYAHAEAMWDGEDYEPWPVVDRERAIVFHLPVGQARCDLYWVDIAAGWEAAQLCGAVRAWRTRKDLAAPLDLLFAQLEASVAATSPAAETVEEGASEEPPSVPSSAGASVVLCLRRDCYHAEADHGEGGCAATHDSAVCACREFLGEREAAGG